MIVIEDGMIVNDAAWIKAKMEMNGACFVKAATMNYSWCFGKDSSSDSQLNNGD